MPENIHIPGTNVCEWPSWAQKPLFQIYPGLAAACEAGAFVRDNPEDLKKYAGEVGGGAGGKTDTPTSALGALGDLAVRLTEGSTYIRIVEIGIGGLILYVGLKAIVTPAGQQVSQQTGKGLANKAAKTGVGLVK